MFNTTANKFRTEERGRGELLVFVDIHGIFATTCLRAIPSAINVAIVGCTVLEGIRAGDAAPALWSPVAWGATTRI